MKYTVGQYLATDTSVLLRVCATLDQEVPLYGVISIKQPEHMHWYVEAELKSYKVVNPNYKQYASLKAGDHVRVGDEYVRVLARIGDAVLLSEAPNDIARHILDMTDHIKEHGGVIVGMNDAQQKALKDATSMKKSHMRADSWYDIDFLMLMNWKVVADEA